MQHIQRQAGVLCLAEIHAGPQKGFANCDSEVVYNCIHGWHGQSRIPTNFQGYYSAHELFSTTILLRSVESTLENANPLFLEHQLWICTLPQHQTSTVQPVS